MRSELLLQTFTNQMGKQMLHKEYAQHISKGYLRCWALLFAFIMNPNAQGFI